MWFLKRRNVCFVCRFVFGVGFSACRTSSSVAAEKKMLLSYESEIKVILCTDQYYCFACGDNHLAYYLPSQSTFPTQLHLCVVFSILE